MGKDWGCLDKGGRYQPWGLPCAMLCLSKTAIQPRLRLSQRLMGNLMRWSSLLASGVGRAITTTPNL